MAADTRPYKSKEQDGQGNEVIIRDQQLVEQSTVTTMPSGACFETLDIDGRPVKIPRDNMMSIVLECIGIVLNDSSKNLGTNVNKALGLQGNTIGNVTVNDLASVLGVRDSIIYNNENVNVNTLRGTRTNGKTLYTIIRGSATITGLPSELDSATVVMVDVEPDNGRYDVRQLAYTREGIAFFRVITNGGETATNWGRVDGYGITSLSGLASALGGITTRYLECSHHNGGSDFEVFKTYVVSEMTASIQPSIIKVDADTFSVAIGIKFNNDYGGFVLIGYTGIYALCLSGGTWTYKRLDQ